MPANIVEQYINDHNFFLQIYYERGKWYCFVHELPSLEDIKFAESGECEDGDLWLDSNVVNQSYAWKDEYNSYSEAVEAGKKIVDSFIKNNDGEKKNRT